MSTPTRPMARLSPVERTALLRTVRERAGVSAVAVDDDRPRPRPAGLVPPATFVQQQLHYLHGLAPDVPNYTTAFAVELHGPLDPRRLREALAGAVHAHESLRTQVRRVDGQLVQEVAAVVPVDIPTHDFGGTPGAALDLLGAGWARAEALARTPFDPGRTPLWRAELAILDEHRTHHLLIWAASHSVFDGVSMGVLLRDLAAGYRDARPPSPSLQLGDVAVWERDRLAGPRRAKLLNYWRERLDGMAPLGFPLDRPRLRQPVLSGDTVYAPIDAELLGQVDALARVTDVTRFTVMLAAYHAVLAGFANARDIAVGVPLDGRSRPGLAEVVGSLVNTVVVRCEVEPRESFRYLLERIRPVVAGAIEHQDLPLGQLVEDLRPRREGAAPPLVQTLFNFAGLPAAGQSHPFTGELTAQLHGLNNGTMRFDFELSIDETAEGVRVRFDHGIAVLDRDSAERIVDAYLGLLRAVATASDTPLRVTLDEVGITTRRAAVAGAAPPATGRRPDLPDSADSPDSPYTPDSPTVGVVAELWAEALEVDSVPLDTDFFTLGGSSLLAVALGERIAKRTGVTVPLIDLLTAESVVELAHTINGSPDAGAPTASDEETS